MNGYDLAAGRYGAVVHEASRNGVLAVVFDMDGTLFDSTACVTAAYRDAVVAAGGPSYTATEIVAAYPLGPPARILGHLLGRPGSLLAGRRTLATLPSTWRLRVGAVRWQLVPRGVTCSTPKHDVTSSL